mmetsp:Transcript_1170/g.2934  ORF Transcript_1170/g.2934 Transcript_1170/m.2934 type:complete len:207 (+) Transcript_1170:20-640(+)
MRNGWSNKRRPSQQSGQMPAYVADRADTQDHQPIRGRRQHHVHGFVNQKHDERPVVHENHLVLCEDFLVRDAVSGAQPDNDKDGLHHCRAYPQRHLVGRRLVQAPVGAGGPEEAAQSDRHEPIPSDVLAQRPSVENAQEVSCQRNRHQIKAMPRTLVAGAVPEHAVSVRVDENCPCCQLPSLEHPRASEHEVQVRRRHHRIRTNLL